MLRETAAKPEAPEPRGTRPEQVRLRARRSPKLVAFGVLLVVLGGLGAGALVTLGSTTESVVTVTRDVARGETLTRDDLAVAEVPVTLDVEATASDQLAELVGQRTSIDLPKGSYPLPRHFEEDPIPTGQAVIGLLLPLGRLPTTDLSPGTKVRLVGLVSNSGFSSEATVTTRPASVEGDTAFAFNVRLPQADAAKAASAMALGELVLVAVEEA